jgi:hypothetical protein
MIKKEKCNKTLRTSSRETSDSLVLEKPELPFVHHASNPD